MKILENASLKAYNTFGIEVYSNYLVSLEETHDAIQLLETRAQLDLPMMVIGGGSNILFRENYPGIISLVRFTGVEKIADDNDHVYIKVAAGENWHDFVRYCLKQGWYGLENLSLIPGLVGAAPVQNIGAYGIELADRFFSLTAISLKTGEHKTFDKTACKFNYRNSVFKADEANHYLIADVTFRLPKIPELRLSYPGIKELLEDQLPTPSLISDIISTIRLSKLPDPEKCHNAGSFFKNPIITEKRLNDLREIHPDIVYFPVSDSMVKLSAAWLIDQCGWKGYREGDAGVSEKHALILVNHGSASGHDIWSLATKILESVLEKFEIVLQPEPVIV